MLFTSLNKQKSRNNGFTQKLRKLKKVSAEVKELEK